MKSPFHTDTKWNAVNTFLRIIEERLANSGDTFPIWYFTQIKAFHRSIYGYVLTPGDPFTKMG